MCLFGHMCTISVQIPMLKEQYALSFWTTSPGPFYNQVIIISIKLLMTLPGKWSILDFKNKIQTINYKTTLVLVCSNRNRSSLSCVCAALKGVYLCRNPGFLRNWPKKKKKIPIFYYFYFCFVLRVKILLCSPGLPGASGNPLSLSQNTRSQMEAPSPTPPLLIY